MICEFTAGTEHWYVDTDKTYVKIFDNIDQRVIKENHNLGLLGQLEGNRIAAYEGTYAMIGVSPHDYHDSLLPRRRQRGKSYRMATRNDRRSRGK